MSPIRRLSAALLVAVLSAGAVGATASSAHAGDTTWGTRIPSR